VQRQRGELADAFAAIEAVLATPQHPHARANALLEQGHLLAHAQDYQGADESFLGAGVEFLAYGDLLGQANAERALAVNDLRLNRRGQLYGTSSAQPICTPRFRAARGSDTFSQTGV